MKSLAFISVLFLVVCCQTPQELFESGINKINKAIERDPSLKLPPDTIFEIQIDTIPGEPGEPFIIRETITETINDCNYDELKTASRRELRFLRKMYNDSLDHVEDLYKLETKRLKDSLIQMNKHYKQEVKKAKSDNKTKVKTIRIEKKGSWFTRFMGKIWWLLLLIGLIGGFYISRYLPQIKQKIRWKDFKES